MYQPWIEHNPVLTRQLVESGEFDERPLRVIDGGARHGVEPHWESFGRAAELLAFEPEAAEYSRLERDGAGPGRRHFPTALGARREKRRLHVARYPDSSSLLEVHPRVARFGTASYMEQIEDIDVEVVDLDSFLRDEGVPYVDFIKLDVEGAELEVLRGAERTVSEHLLGASVEVWFDVEHPGRPLFGEIDEFLRARGFTLFDLRDLQRWRRATLAGEGEASWIGQGQLMYANALYLRDPPDPERGELFELSRESILKLAAIAETFCYPDFAVEVLDLGAERGLIGAQERDLLADPLRRAAAPAGKGRVARRRVLARLIPARLRRRLRQAITALAEE